MDQRAAVWHGVLDEVINAAHLADADDLTRVLDVALGRAGMTIGLYLVDRAQRQLTPVRPGDLPALPIASGPGGWAFRHTEIVPVVDGPRSVLWLPVLNGADRLGVACLALPPGADLDEPTVRGHAWTLTGLIGHLVTSKLQYSDFHHVVRRTEPMSVAAELLWQMLPPQTFATRQMAITAVLEPHSEVGGDGFDYAVDGNRAHMAVFDATGHDVLAGLTTALALAGTRNARRRGLGLVDAAALADKTITDQEPLKLQALFTTAVLATLELDTGVLHHLNAGHPPPVVLRAGHAVRVLPGPARLPLGLGHMGVAVPEVRHEQLQPGDRVLFHSDGITEARAANGTVFGLDRLIDLAERHNAAGLPAPETLRRITRAVLDHQDGVLQDDATLLLLEWRTTAPAVLLPTR